MKGVGGGPVWLLSQAVGKGVTSLLAKFCYMLPGVKKRKNLTSFGQPKRLITCANHGNDVICEVEMKCAVNITGSPIKLHICTFVTLWTIDLFFFIALITLVSNSHVLPSACCIKLPCMEATAL